MKPPERWGKILFVNAVNDVTRERAQSFLEDSHIEKIVRAYCDFVDVPEFTRVVRLNEIRDKGGNLSISLYIRPQNGSEQTAKNRSLTDVIREWQGSSDRLKASMEDLFKDLNNFRRSNSTNPPTDIAS